MQDHDWCKNWSVLGIVGLQALWRESLMRRLHMWLLVSTGLSTHVGKWAVSLALLSKVFYLSFQLGSVSILIKAHSINHINYRKYLEVLQIY